MLITKMTIYRGVRRHSKAQKWIASIKILGKSNYLGYFDSEEGASEVYNLAKEKYIKLRLAKLEEKDG